VTDSEPDPETESDAEDSGTESDAEDSETEPVAESDDAEPDSDEERLEKLGEHIEEVRRSTQSEGGALDEPDERTLNDPEGDGDEGIDGAVPA
jgi:hypothetical protein